MKDAINHTCLYCGVWAEPDELHRCKACGAPYAKLIEKQLGYVFSVNIKHAEPTHFLGELRETLWLLAQVT